jgi:hypothetical protein
MPSSDAGDPTDSNDNSPMGSDDMPHILDMRMTLNTAHLWLYTTSHLRIIGRTLPTPDRVPAKPRFDSVISTLRHYPFPHRQPLWSSRDLAQQLLSRPAPPA